MLSKNPQKIGEANVLPSLPILPTQVALRRNVGSVDVFRAAHLFTFGYRRHGNAQRDPSAYCAQTGRVNEKCGFSGRS